MAGGVTDECGHRLDAVFIEDAVKEFFAFGEGFVPRDFAPGFAVADHGDANSIGVFVQASERGAFGADEPL